MGEPTGLSEEQLRALDRIALLPQANVLHLVGGSAIAVHFGHRRSEDLDLFSIGDVDLGALRLALARAMPELSVRGETEATLKVVADGAVEHHPHFGIDGTYAFHAWYGFAVCAGMVLVSKFVVGLLLKRRDTYYDD